jgi:hypothetical protein
MKFIPKVGEECIFQGNKLVITAVGENSVLAKSPSFVNELALPINEISRPKTTAEMNDEVTKLIEAHNLEQQAKGVEDFTDGNLVGNDLVRALRCIESLHKQAKQLREGVQP